MLNYPKIDPIAISLGPVQIHWYGLMYLVGFLAAWWLGRRRAHRLGLSTNAEQPYSTRIAQVAMAPTPKAPSIGENALRMPPIRRRHSTDRVMPGTIHLIC